MHLGIPGFPAIVLAAALCVWPVSASAQTKPPESASKVKKVMLYNKVGGWLISTGIAEVKATLGKLAAAKGFDLVQVESDSLLTLDYLKQFQVIVWNNNTNGGSSVPSTASRQAILDYVDQGGGWILIHGAGDHANTWPGLAEAMGTAFNRHTGQIPAEVVLDGDGLAHPELKWMLDGFPPAFKLEDLWYSFKNTVRPLPGVTVIATSRSLPPEQTFHKIVPVADGSGDNVYIWARSIGRGRLLYNAIGNGLQKLMKQQDSIVPRLYWQNLRYAAGDFQNGCTNPASAGYDPAARVHVEAMCTAVGVHAPQAISRLILSHGGSKIGLAAPRGPFRARLHDLRGTLVWERDLPAGTAEFALDGADRPGVYHLELRSAEGVFGSRLALP